MSNHFLETNLVIGYTVDWDRQSSVVEQYVDSLSSETTVRTSSRVLNEAEDVINDRRRLAKQAARAIFQDFESGSRRPPVDQLVGFVRSTLSDKRDSAVDHVIQHIEANEFYYTGLTRIESRTGLSSTFSDIDDDFNDAVDVVDSIRRESFPELHCLVFTDILSDYSSYTSFSNIDNELSDSPNDRDILFDAYHLTQEEELDILLFLTMDSDILSSESDFESILETIDIEHPEDV
jgi:predicted nucleic acid-binding protein